MGKGTETPFFNKQSKMLEKAEFINEQPLKVKFFKVTKLDMIITYTFNEEEQTYFILEEELKMEVKLCYSCVIGR